MRWISLISSGYSIQMQNTPSSQVHMEHSPGQTKNQTSVNLRKLKSYQASSLNHDAMRLDFNYKKKTERNTNTWKLNSMFLNNQHITEEIKREIKYLETNDNENMTTQNLWDAAKAVLRGKFIAIQSYLKKH